MTDDEIKAAVEKQKEGFLEHTLNIEGSIEKIRAALGDEEAAKINDELINLQSEVKAVDETHTDVLTDNVKIEDRNKKLVEVNNDLYIKNSQALKGTGSGAGNQNHNENIDDMDDDEALSSFVDIATGKEKDE